MFLTEEQEIQSLWTFLIVKYNTVSINNYIKRNASIFYHMSAIIQWIIPVTGQSDTYSFKMYYIYIYLFI